MKILIIAGLALSLVVSGCLAEDDTNTDDTFEKGLGSSPDDAPDAGEPDKSLGGGKTPIGGVDKGVATSPDEANAFVTTPVENVGGGGECGLDPVEQERNCPGGGGAGGGTCDRIGQSCPPPPGRPYDAVCAYEQRPEGGCVCRCFVPGTPAFN